MMMFHSKTSSINWTTGLPSVWMFAVVCLTMVSANPISPRAHATGRSWSEECYATSPNISSLISLAAVTQHSVEHLMKRYETEVYKDDALIQGIKSKYPFTNNDLNWNASLAKADYSLSIWFLKTAQRSATTLAKLILRLEAARVGESLADNQHVNYAGYLQTIHNDTYTLLCSLHRSAAVAGVQSNAGLDSILNTKPNEDGVRLQKTSERHERDYITLRDLDLVLNWFLDADEIFRVLNDEVKHLRNSIRRRPMRKLDNRKRKYNEIQRIVSLTNRITDFVEGSR